MIVEQRTRYDGVLSCVRNFARTLSLYTEEVQRTTGWDDPFQSQLVFRHGTESAIDPFERNSGEYDEQSGAVHSWMSLVFIPSV